MEIDPHQSPVIRALQAECIELRKQIKGRVHQNDFVGAVSRIVSLEKLNQGEEKSEKDVNGNN